MANDEHLNIIHQGVKTWNKWRNGKVYVNSPDLSFANLRGAELSYGNLAGANLAGANLAGATLTGANLTEANLTEANLTEANLSGASLVRAKLHGAILDDANLRTADIMQARLNNASLIYAKLDAADLSFANLAGANLREAECTTANFTGAILVGADLSLAKVSHTVFADNDLRHISGLERMRHWGPSTVSISTIYLSEGQIQEEFLRECGVPDEFIIQIPALVAAVRPIQFHSCFISYSGKDEEFARRFHERMRAAGLRVWFAPEDIKGGEKLYEQIDRAIQVHDRLLLVLSEHSMKSEWVMTELRRARKAEVKEGRRKLFPIRLVDFDTLREWECFDSDQGKDLAVEVREYFIPDFSNWKSHDDFEVAFKRLLDDLKASV